MLLAYKLTIIFDKAILLFSIDIPVFAILNNINNANIFGQLILNIFPDNYITLTQQTGKCKPAFLID